MFLVWSVSVDEPRSSNFVIQRQRHCSHTPACSEYRLAEKRNNGAIMQSCLKEKKRPQFDAFALYCVSIAPRRNRRNTQTDHRRQKTAEKKFIVCHSWKKRIQSFRLGPGVLIQHLLDNGMHERFDDFTREKGPIENQAFIRNPPKCVRFRYYYRVHVTSSARTRSLSAIQDIYTSQYLLLSSETRSPRHFIVSSYRICRSAYRVWYENG